MRRIEIKAGERYGHLTVTGKTSRDESGHLIYECECVCGKIVYARGDALYRGYRKSCGCMRSENCRKARLKVWEERRAAGRMSTKRETGQEPVVIKPVDKDKFNDWWMFGSTNEIKRLRKMFH